MSLLYIANCNASTSRVLAKPLSYKTGQVSPIRDLDDPSSLASKPHVLQSSRVEILGPAFSLGYSRTKCKLEVNHIYEIDLT
ncbi:hypothetical protein CsSME_00031390 [Camellia sinensis var. sinensis]